MTVQKVKTKNYAEPLEATLHELTALFDEKDDRFEKMSRFYPQERDLLLRQELLRK